MKKINIIPYNRLFIAILMLLLSLSLLAADELEDKMQQLRSIERQIDLIQQKARQAEQKKRKAQTDIETSQRSKVQTDATIKKLQEKEAIVQDSLMVASQRVKNNEEKIADLKQLANHEFLRLFYIDVQDRYIAKASKDKYFLSMLVSITTKSITDLSEYHKLLIQTQELRRNEFYRVRSSRTKEVKKSEQFVKKIQSLSQQATKLEKEKQSYEQQISKLRKDAAELESLIAKLAAQSSKVQHSYQFSQKKIPWPVKGRIIREFGEEYKGNNTSIINNGIDIAVPEGSNVISVDDGEVIFSDRYGGQGKLIIIDHKNGFFSVYAYNNELLVSKGTIVKKGQVIAKSGQTGSASQPSLHFELRKDGKAVNPLNYFE